MSTTSVLGPVVFESLWPGDVDSCVCFAGSNSRSNPYMFAINEPNNEINNESNNEANSEAEAATASPPGAFVRDDTHRFCACHVSSPRQA